MHLRASIKQKNLCQSICFAAKEWLGNQSHHSFKSRILSTAKHILSSGWDSDARILTSEYLSHLQRYFYADTKFQKFLMQTLNQVYRNKSLVSELRLHGNHLHPLLATACITTQTEHFPPNASRLTSHQHGLHLPWFASPTAHQNQASLHRLTRLFSHKPNRRDILILQQNSKLNYFSPVTFPHELTQMPTEDFSQVKLRLWVNSKDIFKHSSLSTHCCTLAAKQFFWRLLKSWIKPTSAFRDSLT